LHFTGGPISVVVRIGEQEPRSYSFAADPYFRKPDNYVASGSLALLPSLEVSKPVLVIAQFTNAAQANATYRLDLALPMRTDESQQHPVQTEGTVAPGKTANFVIYLCRA
jgi:hypothetical protein